MEIKTKIVDNSRVFKLFANSKNKHFSILNFILLLKYEFENFLRREKKQGKPITCSKSVLTILRKGNILTGGRAALESAIQRIQTLE